VATFEELIDVADAIVMAVPPDIQAHYAPLAAQAGKALLLEKPLGLSLAQAEDVAAAVRESGVVNQVMFTNRYTARGRKFIAEARERIPIGAVAQYINGLCLSGDEFATPWRMAKGALLDLGPHVLDLLDASVGPIVDVTAKGDPTRWFTLTAEHEGGALSEAALSLNSPMGGGEIANLRLFTERGPLTLDFYGKDDDPGVPDVIRGEFVAAVAAGQSHEIDVERALYIQRLLDMAERSASVIRA
jgi:predicted dehydrogenase